MHPDQVSYWPRVTFRLFFSMTFYVTIGFQCDQKTLTQSAPWTFLSCFLEIEFLYQMIIWHLVVCPGSFALASLHTGQFSEKSLQNNFWKLLYMKLHKIHYSWVCDVILTGLGSTNSSNKKWGNWTKNVLAASQKKKLVNHRNFQWVSVKRHWGCIANLQV